MAIITYPLNNITYDAAAAELYFCTRSSGVFAVKDNLDCSISGDREITISPGIAWIRNDRFSGKVAGLLEAETLMIDAAEQTLPRIDRVVLRFDAAANATGLFIKKGTPASSPAASARETGAGLYELVLYDLYIRPATAAIAAEDIFDRRKDPALCGLMKNEIDALEDAVPLTRMINGKALAEDIFLYANDTAAFALDHQTVIPAGKDLNSYTIPGNFAVKNSTTANEISNVPFETGFSLYVLKVNAVDGYYIQLAIGTTGAIRLRRTYNNGSTWSKWRGLQFEIECVTTLPDTAEEGDLFLLLEE